METLGEGLTLLSSPSLVHGREATLASNGNCGISGVVCAHCLRSGWGLQQVLLCGSNVEISFSISSPDYRWCVISALSSHDSPSGALQSSENLNGESIDQSKGGQRQRRETFKPHGESKQKSPRGEDNNSKSQVI